MDVKTAIEAGDVAALQLSQARSFGHRRRDHTIAFAVELRRSLAYYPGGVPREEGL